MSEEWGQTSEPLSDEELERQRQEASAALWKLTVFGLAVSTAATVVGVALWMSGVPGAEGFTKGVALGGFIGVLNLRILARALWGLMSGQKLSPLVGILASFGVLIILAAWLAVEQQSWVFGYGVGLALPAPTGIWFALSAARAEAAGEEDQAP